MEFIGIIPARYASTRFPGKPLVDINGKTMIQRVYEQVSKVLGTVIVATDDTRIYEAVEAFGGKAEMTSADHKSGTDRCFECLAKVSESYNKNFNVVINIQGDEPFIAPEQLILLKSCFDNENTQIATLIKTIEDSNVLFDTNTPKVVINKTNNAIYFSRETIPHIRNYPKNDWLKHHVFYKHIGIYAYKVDTLSKITSLSQTSLEISESLEQNRWIEHGFAIKTAITQHESIAIDTPDDLKLLEKII